MSSSDNDDLGALANFLAAVVVLIVAAFVVAHLLCGLALNFFVRLLFALANRIKRIGPRWVLFGVLAPGALLLRIVSLAPLYPDSSVFLAAVGTVIALCGYYGGNWGYEMPFQSEAAMRAQEGIIRTRFRMWGLAFRYRLRLAWLALLNSLGF